MPTAARRCWSELAEPDAVARATAADLKDLTRPQASVATWLSRRYKVAPEPIGRLVKEAWSVGERSGLDPTLILAIMAIESSFNPFAQSPVGAQGLMQVMTNAARREVRALRRQPRRLRPGDQPAGRGAGAEGMHRPRWRPGGRACKYYVGAANLDTDGGYAGKVLAEQSRLRMVASGRSCR